MGHDGRYYDPNVPGQEPTQIPENSRQLTPLNDLLVKGRVPTGDAFDSWFDNLSPADFERLCANGHRESIKRQIREPGGEHEWCMACRASQFKRWNVSMAEIKRFRTGTGDLTWTIPPGRANAGDQGGHSGVQTGSTRFHNELRAIIDESTTLQSTLGEC